MVRNGVNVKTFKRVVCKSGGKLFRLSIHSIWWGALFFLKFSQVNSNQLSFSSQCWDHSWYIANGTTFYLLSPLLLFPLLTKGSKFLFTITGVVVAQILATISYIYLSIDDLRGALELAQKSPLFRAGPWVFGIIAGYLYYLHKYKEIGLGKVRRCAWWIQMNKLSLTYSLAIGPINTNTHFCIRLFRHNSNFTTKPQKK